MVAFVRQYQYNSDMAPDRMQLQNMCKKGHESFKEYTQRWRDLAAQVALLMLEREMMIVMVDTLSVSYYEKMVGYTPLSFFDLVFANEMIEMGLKRGKFNHLAWTNEKTGANEEGENEGETHAATVVPTWKLPHQLNKHHYSANIIPSHYPPPSHPQRPSLNQPQSLSTTLPITNTTISET